LFFLLLFGLRLWKIVERGEYPHTHTHREAVFDLIFLGNWGLDIGGVLWSCPHSCLLIFYFFSLSLSIIIIIIGKWGKSRIKKNKKVTVGALHGIPPISKSSHTKKKKKIESNKYKKTKWWDSVYSLFFTLLQFT